MTAFPFPLTAGPCRPCPDEGEHLCGMGYRDRVCRFLVFSFLKVYREMEINAVIDIPSGFYSEERISTRDTRFKRETRRRGCLLVLPGASVTRLTDSTLCNAMLVLPRICKYGSIFECKLVSIRQYTPNRTDFPSCFCQLGNFYFVSSQKKKRALKC